MDGRKRSHPLPWAQTLRTAPSPCQPVSLSRAARTPGEVLKKPCAWQCAAGTRAVALYMWVGGFVCVRVACPRACASLRLRGCMCTLC
eukprot:359101-Chlamydomonas_euryale.AAC.3